MEKGFKVLVILAAIPVLLFVYLLVVLTLSSGGASGLFVHGVKPKIREAEFDFKLVYEVYEQTYEYEGSFVCKFEGFINGGGAKDRKWSIIYKDAQGNEINENLICSFDDKHDIHLFIRRPGYFMGDPDIRINNEKEYYITVTDVNTGFFSWDELAEREAFVSYDFEIISWECDPPIENEYR